MMKAILALTLGYDSMLDMAQSQSQMLLLPIKLE